MSETAKRTTESRVREILRHPLDHEWSIQGFGMLRTYLDDEHVERLHIWDTTQAVESVSTIHDHPWDFESRIVSGAMGNQRYEYDTAGTAWKAQQIVCGVGGHLVGEPTLAHLREEAPERYESGEGYSMLAPELHDSFPTRGTVSIIRRRFHEDKDIATVLWTPSGEWVSAEPREATPDVILYFVALAHKMWSS